MALKSLKDAGIEDPNKGGLIASLRLKIKKNEDIHGDFNVLLSNLEKIEKERNAKGAKLLKEFNDKKDEFDKMKAQKEDIHRQIRNCMMEDDFYSTVIKDEILKNDFDKNFERFEKMIEEKRKRHIEIDNDGKRLARTLTELKNNQQFKMDPRAVRWWNRAWSNITEYMGEDYVAEKRTQPLSDEEQAGEEEHVAEEPEESEDSDEY